MSKWKLIKKNIVYQNNFLTLREDEVIDPNGNPKKWNLLEAGYGSVVIVPVNEKGEFILIGQERYATDEFSWEFPGGGIKKGENPRAAAERELAEEAGVSAGKLTQLLSYYPLNSVMNQTSYVFLAENLTENLTANKDAHEKIEKRFIGKDMLLKEIKEGKIKDSFTLCGTLNYLLSFEENL